MAERAEDVQRFLRLCENSAFPHREELLNGINSGEYRLESYSHSEVPSESLLETYLVKAKVVAGHVGEHARRLASDTAAFIEELTKVSREKVNFWHFSVNESSGYTLFEGEDCGRILGCIFTVDRRKVSESDWEKLWSEAGLPGTDSKK